MTTLDKIKLHLHDQFQATRGNRILDTLLTNIGDEHNALTAKVKDLEKDKARLDWLELRKASLDCTMGAPGNYHYQVGIRPSESSYRQAIDRAMAAPTE